MNELLHRWIDGLANAASLPSDSEDERLRKTILLLVVVGGMVAGTSWGIMYFILGLPVSGAIPFGYGVLGTSSLLYFLRTKRYRFFRFSQLLFYLLLPTALQWSLGGFAASSAVILWALMAPLGALMFAGRKQSVPWFVAYLALVGLSGLFDGRLSQNAAEMPHAINTAFFVMNFYGVFFILYFTLNYFVRERDDAFERSEGLLLNILPKSIADRLKHGPRTIADGYHATTILFADMVDFTPMSRELEPVEMVELLNEVFSYLDSLVEKYDVEKIKTIGDAYMVAAGVPRPHDDHAQAIAHMALEMRTYVSQQPSVNGRPLSFRIGMNSGPVVAGVIGHKKFIYDMWGDVVNTASRMESHGISGKIQITQQTYDLLKDEFACEPRGTIAVKGTGDMETWFLLEARE